MVKSGLSMFRNRFPSTVLDWSNRKEFCLGQVQDDIAMANTARYLGFRDLHLRALYDCCQLSADVLLDNVALSSDAENEDGP